MSTAENKRSVFIRKYAKRVHGIDISREDSLKILQELFIFMVKYLGGYFKADDFLVGSKETAKEKFGLNKDIWTMFPHADDDILYRCDACGCETHLDTHGV